MNVNEFASSFQLLQSNVLELSFSNKEVVYGPSENVQRTYDTDYKIINMNEDEEALYGAVELTIQVRRIIKDFDSGFELKLRLNGIFTAPLNMPEDAFCQMLEFNGVAALYSIARAKITALSSLCYPSEPVIIPMANINSLVAKQREKNKNNSAKNTEN